MRYWRDDAQARTVVATLLKRQGFSGWIDGGALVEPPDVQRLARAHQALYLVARWVERGVHGRDAEATLDDALALDPHDRRAVLELLRAVDAGHAAVDRWIEHHAESVRGPALCAMRVADPDRWARAVADVLARARTVDDAFERMGVSKTTGYGWLRDPRITGREGPRAFSTKIRKRGG